METQVKKIFIVLPTYNEKENISELINELFTLNLPRLYILVVDDNSPDGTGEIVENLKLKYTNLQIIHRSEKKGLGTAYVEGFKKALSQGADLIFEMDADFSHKPEYILDFLESAREYDLVLGSRYVKGGKIENWKILRRLISRFGNIYAQVILGLPIKDLTGGFKCYHKRVLKDMDFDNLSSIGYNFQIETTYKSYKKGFKIKEIPIVFTERKLGESKFNFKIILESFFKVILLKIKK